MNDMSKIVLLLLILLSIQSKAYLVEPEYEEISIFVRIQGVGGFEVNAIYDYDTNALFLPVTELFQALRVKYEVSPDHESITGFLISEDKFYLIDYKQKIIQFNKQIFALKEGDILKTEMDLFLNSSLFGRVFGLFATFNFRTLSVEIKTDLELPAIRELRLTQMRKNIEQLRGEVKVDTTYMRKYNLLKTGMADWGLSSTQYTGGRNDTRANISFGAEILGGEANAFLNYSSRYGFSDRNQHYFWRWANNELDLVRQIRVGRINPSSVSSIYDPVVGITITNSPTTFRRSFGTYTISDFTEPGWTVELYINNVVVDYQVADASGFFSFDVPLIYGTSQITTKYYGPYGEERIREQFLNIPFNFLPKGEIEYTLSGGMVQDQIHSAFGKAETRIGVNRFMTIGGGFEYLSSIETGKEIPIISATLRPLRSLIVAGEYAEGVRSLMLLNYRLPSNFMIDIEYIRYKPGQKAIRYNYLEERKATLSTPFRLAFIRGYSRFSYRQNVYDLFSYNSTDFIISAFSGKISANLSTFANWIESANPYIFSNLSGSIRLAKGYVLRTQGQIDITNASMVFIKAELEKRISRSGYFSMTAEENFRSAFRSFEFNFRWDFPFAQSNFSARYTGGELISTQGARGSFAFGSGNGKIVTGNRTTVGRGGLTIYPFLDINHNGKKEDNEPFVSGMSVRINGGRILKDQNDSIIRIIDLEPYTNYILELNDVSLEEIAWQLKNRKIRVYIDPNQFKKIEIPVLPMGEVNGWVYISDERGIRGQGRIIINIFSKNGNKVASIMTEPDGGFTYLGLPPGNYFAEVDLQQIERLGFTRKPERIDFEIKPNKYGDIIDGLDFIITKNSH